MAAACARARRRNAPCRAGLRFPGRSWPLLAFERRSSAVCLGLLFAPALPVDREAVALQGRAERAGAPRRTLVGAAGASGSHPFLLRSSGEGSEALARTGNPCRGCGPPDQWPVAGRWLGNICLTEVVSARSIINLMMRCEGKVATILIARDPMIPAEAVGSVSGSPRRRPVLTFWLRLSIRPSRQHRQKALDSSLKQMENKERTWCLCQS